jgi:hypothetical protein
MYGLYADHNRDASTQLMAEKNSGFAHLAVADAGRQGTVVAAEPFPGVIDMAEDFVLAIATDHLSAGIAGEAVGALAPGEDLPRAIDDVDAIADLIENSPVKSCICLHHGAAGRVHRILLKDTARWSAGAGTVHRDRELRSSRFTAIQFEYWLGA